MASSNSLLSPASSAIKNIPKLLAAVPAWNERFLIQFELLIPTKVDTTQRQRTSTGQVQPHKKIKGVASTVHSICPFGCSLLISLLLLLLFVIL